MKITIAQSVDRGRGLCSTCEYFSAQLFDNGDQRFVCRRLREFLRRRVVECTDYSRKNNGMFSQAAWQISLDPETDAVEFRDASYRRYRLEDGKVLRIKDDDD